MSQLETEEGSVPTVEDIRSLKSHTSWVCTVLYYPEHKRIFSGSGDNAIISWDSKTFENIEVNKLHNGQVYHLIKFRRNIFLSASSDGTVNSFCAETFKRLKTFKCIKGREIVHLLKLSDDLFLTVSSSNLVHTISYSQEKVITTQTFGGCIWNSIPFLSKSNPMNLFLNLNGDMSDKRKRVCHISFRSIFFPDSDPNNYCDNNIIDTTTYRTEGGLEIVKSYYSGNNDAMYHIATYLEAASSEDEHKQREILVCGGYSNHLFFHDTSLDKKQDDDKKGIETLMKSIQLKNVIYSILVIGSGTRKVHVFVGDSGGNFYIIRVDGFTVIHELRLHKTAIWEIKSNLDVSRNKFDLLLSEHHNEKTKKIKIVTCSSDKSVGVATISNLDLDWWSLLYEGDALRNSWKDLMERRDYFSTDNQDQEMKETYFEYVSIRILGNSSPIYICRIFLCSV